jgi:phosphoglycerate dehydrogenase-like enzyme
MSLRVTVPTDQLRRALAPQLPGVTVDVWDLQTPPPATELDAVVVPHLAPPHVLESLSHVRTRMVQMQSNGYEFVEQYLGPRTVLCSAAGVHEVAAAELAVAMMVSIRRDLGRFLDNQRRQVWQRTEAVGMRGQRVLILGAGNLGNEITRKLQPFDAHIIRVARSQRSDQYGPVLTMAHLPRLLPTADIVVLALPASAATHHLVNAEFLAQLPDDALIVNFARGSIIDSDALVAECASGRLRASLDVTDPEPLPPGHPLWTTMNIFVSPHAGGHVSTTEAEIERLLVTQFRALQTGQPLANVVAVAAAVPPRHEPALAGSPTPWEV